MQYHKTSSLVESGILAAVAVLFTLVGNYIPVLDLIVSILWPLPIILCGRRNGLKWSILCLLVTGCGVAGLLSPLLGDAVIAELTCVGSLLIVALSLNMLNVTKIKVMNLVPAIFLPILLCWFM